MGSAIDLASLGDAAFDFFPPEYLAQATKEQALTDKYQQHLAILHTDKLWDLSKIHPGYRVTTFDGYTGTITSHHTTDIGKANGCVEVQLDNGKLDYYYPNQLTRILCAKN